MRAIIGSVLLGIGLTAAFAAAAKDAPPGAGPPRASPPEQPGPPPAPSYPALPPGPFVPNAGFEIVCTTSGLVGGVAKNGAVYISFSRAARGSAAAQPGPGECAWVDRAVNGAEPTCLYAPRDVAIPYDLNNVLTSFAYVRLRAYNSNVGWLIITELIGAGRDAGGA